MALVNVANSAPTAIRLTSVPPPGRDPAYSVDIAGNRSPGAASGFGFTFDVDADVFNEWIAMHPQQGSVMQIVTQQQIDALVTLENHPATYGYEQALQPPINRTVPYASQQGAVLNCTMGTWVIEPSSYTYAWQLDGVEAGADSATYDVQPGDVGKTACCVVTASNANGSTAAPPSNAVVVA